MNAKFNKIFMRTNSWSKYNIGKKYGTMESDMRKTDVMPRMLVYGDRTRHYLKILYVFVRFYSLKLSFILLKCYNDIVLTK